MNQPPSFRVGRLILPDVCDEGDVADGIGRGEQPSQHCLINGSDECIQRINGFGTPLGRISRGIAYFAGMCLGSYFFFSFCVHMPKEIYAHGILWARNEGRLSKRIHLCSSLSLSPFTFLFLHSLTSPYHCTRTRKMACNDDFGRLKTRCRIFSVFDLTRFFSLGFYMFLFFETFEKK